MSIRERVRQVFLKPQCDYPAVEAAELLGWKDEEMQRAIAEGDIEAERTCSGFRIAWEEVAAMITAQYPQQLVEQSLGNDASSVMPELVRLAELRVSIPRYQAAMLSSLADREHISVDELLARHLLDLAGAEITWLQQAIPQFETAMRWPEA